MRVLGVNLPDQEKSKIALTRVYGIGRVRAKQLLAELKIDSEKRLKDLGSEEVVRLTKALGSLKVEGDLRKQVSDNIERLKAIRSYRGIRHILNMPVRGQRTRVNARTRRGKKKTVGALTKEMWAKIETQQKAAMAKKA
ncbi:MAG: 30S ribosomal protein S13 [Patescibacteria group bacterium]